MKFLGEVYFAKNNLAPRVIIHVDTSVRLWAYFDVYGTTQKIRVLGNFGFDKNIGKLQYDVRR